VFNLTETAAGLGLETSLSQLSWNLQNAG